MMIKLMLMLRMIRMMATSSFLVPMVMSYVSTEHMIMMQASLLPQSLCLMAMVMMMASTMLVVATVLRSRCISL